MFSRLVMTLMVAALATGTACSSLSDTGSPTPAPTSAGPVVTTPSIPIATVGPTAPARATATVIPPTSTARPEPTPTPVSTATPIPEPTAPPKPEDPEISPSSGTYRGPTTIVFLENFSGEIFYTLDGSDPSRESGELYSGPFQIFDSTTVMAVAIDDFGSRSDLLEAEYVIEKPQLDPPGIELAGGLYIGAQSVEITDFEGAQIVYTLDGSEPTSENGLIYNGPVTVEGLVTLKAAVVKPGFTRSNVVEKTYRVVGELVESSEPISLSGDDVLEIVDTHFVHRGPITLRGNSELILRDSVIQHDKDFAFEFELSVFDDARVVVESSGVATTCTGSFNWAFHDSSSLIADGMDPVEGLCNTWNFMSGSSLIDVAGWDTFSGTVCNQSNVSIRESRDMEIEFCFPEGIKVDTELPIEIDQFVFSGDDDNTVEFALEINDSTIDGWGINVLPGSDITIRNTPSITVGVIVGRPWVERTVEIEGLAATTWADRTWEIGDARLRLVNTHTYGWEPNVFADNTLIIRDSDYSGSAINGGFGHYIIENSRIGQLVANENVTMDVTNSVITGDVIANGNSVITLVDSQVGEEESDSSGSGSVFARDSGQVILRNTLVLGETVEQDGGVITEE